VRPLRGPTLTRPDVQSGAAPAIGVVVSAAVPAVALAGGVWLLPAAALVVLAGAAVQRGTAVHSGAAVQRGTAVRLAPRIAEAAWLCALWLAGAPAWLAGLCAVLAWRRDYLAARSALIAVRPGRSALAAAALALGGLAALVSPHLAAGTVTVVLAVWITLGLLGAVP
jgi:archaetidylinositol phosphate synthase